MQVRLWRIGRITIWNCSGKNHCYQDLNAIGSCLTIPIHLLSGFLSWTLKLAQIFFEWMQNYHANQGNSTGTQKLMVEPTQLILESPQLILNSPVNRNKVKYEAMFVVLTESFNKKCVFYTTGILCILSWIP